MTTAQNGPRRTNYLPAYLVIGLLLTAAGVVAYGQWASETIKPPVTTVEPGPHSWDGEERVGIVELHLDSQSAQFAWEDSARKIAKSELRQEADGTWVLPRELGNVRTLVFLTINGQEQDHVLAIPGGATDLLVSSAENAGQAQRVDLTFVPEQVIVRQFPDKTISPSIAHCEILLENEKGSHQSQEGFLWRAEPLQRNSIAWSAPEGENDCVEMSMTLTYQGLFPQRSA